MVYVQDIDGKPLMPTTRHGKVRRLLKDKKAVVVNLCPFTIKLMYVTSDYKQEIVLGVDAGTKHVGLSATTKSKELYASEVILRNDIINLLSTRRELRKARKNTSKASNLDFGMFENTYFFVMVTNASIVRKNRKILFLISTISNRERLVEIHLLI